ncbi:MAG: DNA repair protein RecO [Tannerellaceae bacterium]|jgi:DNA repair protein RecO (recombination protein O)|nr:DNA repair protein RecO [Tannerellaceae bacterium]
MLSKTRAIILHSIPYNEAGLIVHTYTETSGRLSCLAARNKKKRSPLPGALFMPLSVVEMEMERRPGRDLSRLLEARLCFPLTRLSSDPVKSSLALFLAEMLYRVLKETEPDPRLFDFLYHSIHLLEESGQGIANFHLVFLLHLLRYLGISPNVDAYCEGAWFDMQNGIFASRPPLHRHYLDKDESRVFASLFRISYENMSLYAFSRHDRVHILHKIIAYYRLHLPEVPEIKSLPILQTLFDDLE